MTAVDVLPDQAGDRNSFGILAESLLLKVPLQIWRPRMPNLDDCQKAIASKRC